MTNITKLIKKITTTLIVIVMFFVTVVAIPNSPALAVSSTTKEPIPLIFDDDGSQDGMTALAYLLADPKFDIKAITDTFMRNNAVYSRTELQ